MKTLFFVIILSVFVPYPGTGTGNTPPTGDYGSGNLTGESIYIHTDRDLYLAGENLFFCAYISQNGHKGEESSNIIYIALRNEQNVVIQKLNVLLNEKGIAFGHLYLPDNLQTGYYQLVSFTNWMRNLGEDAFFTKQLFVAGRFDKTLDAVKTDTAREIVMNLTEYSGEVNSLNDLQPLTHSFPDGSLNIEIENPVCRKEEQMGFTISYTNPDDSIAFVSVSIVNAVFLPDKADLTPSQTYDPKKNNSSLRYFRENEQIILSGFLIDIIKQHPVAHARVLLTTPDTIVNLQYANTLSDGSFHFSLNPYYESKELFLCTDKTLGVTDARITVTDKFQFELPFIPAPFKFNANTKDLILREQDILRIKKVYNIPEVKKQAPQKNSVSFIPLVYSKPVYSIKPAEYIPLDDLIEISKEILSPVRLRKQDDRYTIRLLNNRASMSAFNDPPLIFLDGVLVEDVNSIIHFSSDHINKIEILNLLWVYGEMQFPGIIALFTKNKGENISHTPSSGFRTEPFSFNVPGLYLNRVTDKDSTPDFRQLLYWEPGIMLKYDKAYTSEFYTGNLSGDYAIVVEGFTKSGKRIATRKYITVVN